MQHLYSLHPPAIQPTDEFTSVHEREHTLFVHVSVYEQERACVCVFVFKSAHFLNFPLSSLSGLSGFVSNYSTLFVAPGGLCSVHARM